MGGSRTDPADPVLECWICGAPALVLPDTDTLLFMCDAAHLYSVRDLMTLSLAPGGRPDPALLATWLDRARGLELLACTALSLRRLPEAARLLDAAVAIKERVRELMRLRTPAPSAEAPLVHGRRA